MRPITPWMLHQARRTPTPPVVWVCDVDNADDEALRLMLVQCAAGPVIDARPTATTGEEGRRAMREGCRRAGAEYIDLFTHAYLGSGERARAHTVLWVQAAVRIMGRARGGSRCVMLVHGQRTEREVVQVIRNRFARELDPRHYPIRKRKDPVMDDKDAAVVDLVRTETEAILSEGP